MERVGVYVPDKAAWGEGGAAPSSAQPVVSPIETIDRHGWHVLLGEHLAGRLLCVDLAAGEPSSFFRSLGGEVEIIDLTKSRERQSAQLCEALEARLAASAESAFDGFVLHDLQGLVVNAGEPGMLDRMLRAVNRLLKPGGFCYLGFRNARALFGGGRRSSAGRDAPLTEPGAVLDQFARSGFDPRLVRLYPYLLADDSVFEVLPERGYTSVKNSRRWREHVKEWCYGRFGARRWAPGYGLVASKQAVALSLVERLGQQLSRLSTPGTEPFHLLRCQIASRKVFLSYGPAGSRYGRLVAVYTRDDRTIARREVEAGVLERLVRKVPVLRGKVPQVLARDSLGTYTYFVLSELPGMSIDGPCPGTRSAIDHAARLLLDLHTATAEWCKSAPDVFERLVGSIFPSVYERYPELREDIEPVEAEIRRRGEGRDWLTVWQHGDYKLENVILDPRSLEVAGVIDWELSREHGLPLIDLLYLLAYNRSVNQGGHLSTVYLTSILPWRFSAQERQLLDDYLARLGLPMDDPVLWAAIYMLHDIGIRHQYIPAIRGHRELLERMLRETARALSLPARQHEVGR